MGTDKTIVAYRAGSFNPRLIISLAAVSLVGLVGLLEISCRTGVVGPLSFPAPSAIGTALVELYNSGQLHKHVAASLSRLAVGWSLGGSVGIITGFGIGIATIARSVGIPWVAAVSAIPKIALLPLFIIWFGIGEGSKYATIAFGTFFPTVINTFGGVDNIQKNLVRMGQSFNLKKQQLFGTLSCQVPCLPFCQPFVYRLP